MTLQDAISFALDHNTAIEQQVVAVTSAEHNLAILQNSTFPNLSATLQNQAAQSRNYSGAYSIIGATQNNSFSQNTRNRNQRDGQSRGQRAHPDGGRPGAGRAGQVRAHQCGEPGGDVGYQRLLLRDSKRASSKWTSRRSATRTRWSRRPRRNSTREPRPAWTSCARRSRGIKPHRTWPAPKPTRERSREPRADDRRAAHDAVRLPKHRSPAATAERHLGNAPEHRGRLAARRALGPRIAGRGPPDAQDVERELAPSAQINGSFGNQFSPTAFVQEQAQSPVPLPAEARDSGKSA